MQASDQLVKAREQLRGREEIARRAFACLEPEVRRFLTAYLRQRIDSDGAADVVQETLLRVWTARSSFEERGEAAWRAFLKRIADRCVVDRYRQVGRLEALPDDIPEREAGDLESLIPDGCDARAQCLEAADELWLELPTGMRAEERSRRLLAAQLFILDELRWSEIVEILNASSPAAPVSRGDLDGWLSEPGVLRHLAFTHLYLGPEELATAVIQPESFPGEGGSRVGPPWSPAEALVILWRVRHGLGIEQIAARADCPFAMEALRELDVRLTAAFPFTGQVRLLRKCLERRRMPPEPILGGLGLWQRLAFQYRYLDDLPVRDVLERVGPAAREVGVQINPGVLNMWLSGGRLLGRLARQMRRTCGEEEG